MRMTLPSGAVSGRSFPLAGGSSVMSTKSLTRIHSRSFLGTIGRPCIRGCMGLGFYSPLVLVLRRVCCSRVG